MTQRAQDLGIIIGQGTPGPLNAITDVPGVRVGHASIHADLADGRSVRTGVTVIEPRPGSARHAPCFAGVHVLNGNGDATGLEWVREAGLLTSPIAFTNTHSVGVVRDALIALERETLPAGDNAVYWNMPVVMETFDGLLNDINGFHVKAEHVRQAQQAAQGGLPQEGAVGGGSGMICHEFKGGSGTASRRLPADQGGWTVGAIVQANHGKRESLLVGGYPVGRHLGHIPSPFTPQLPHPGMGSIVVALTTDAPLLPHQCARLAQRASIGIARTGGGTEDSSGDIFIAFATGNDGLPPADYANKGAFTTPLRMVNNDYISALFAAAAEAVEEAIVNALLAANTVSGNGHRAEGLSAEQRDGAGAGRLAAVKKRRARGLTAPCLSGFAARLGRRIVVIQPQRFGVDAVPQLLVQLVQPPAHRRAVHHQLQIARVVQIAAGPVAGAHPGNLIVDGHQLAVDHPGKRNEAAAGRWNGHHFDLHVRHQRQALQPGDIRLFGVPVGHHQLDLHPACRRAAQRVVDHRVEGAAAFGAERQRRVIHHLHPHPPLGAGQQARQLGLRVNHPRRVVGARAGHQIVALRRRRHRRIGQRRHRFILRQQRLRLPILLEDRLDLPHHLGVADAQPGFVNMLQRAPVEVLAADERLLAVHQQILGVQNAAAQLLVRNNAQLQIGDRLQLFQRLGGRNANALIFHQKADFHPAFAGRLQVLQHAVQQRTVLIRHVELPQIDAGFAASNISRHTSAVLRRSSACSAVSTGAVYTSS